MIPITKKDMRRGSTSNTMLLHGLIGTTGITNEKRKTILLVDETIHKETSQELLQVWLLSIAGSIR